MTTYERPRRRRAAAHSTPARKLVQIAVLAASAPLAMAQSCVSLRGSTTCPAFNTSSVSTGSDVSGLFPFLQYVSTTQDFDRRLTEYVASSYVQQKYQQLLGCNNVSLSNSSAYYARYTTSVVCNAIIQNSIRACSLSGRATTPLCADSCAQQAISEEEIVADKSACGTPGSNYLTQIRADFTNCALPANSLSGACITGEENEPTDCGFASNLGGLCRFCAASSPNATDSCCVASNVTHRCTGVTLPSLLTMPSLFPSGSSAPTSTPSAGATSAPASGSNGNGTSTNNGLSGGAIAGIVIGSIVAAALLIGLLLLCCIAYRRRKRRNNEAALPVRNSPPTSLPRNMTEAQPGVGGRVARMTALEGSSSSEKGRPNPILAAEQSSSDPYDDSHTSQEPSRPVTGRRQGSLSSGSAFGAVGNGHNNTSPSNQLSSPEGMQSGQSEQLSTFKDYYSSDEIHPGDRVATLWAYQPRAGDEFELERGDMLKIVGIWDDGWATGIRLDDRAEDFDSKRKAHRDSAVSDTGLRRQSMTPNGEVKAFPLVCVCLPQHWRKTIEGDSSTDTNSPPPERTPGSPDGGGREVGSDEGTSGTPFPPV